MQWLSLPRSELFGKAFIHLNVNYTELFVGNFFLTCCLCKVVLQQGYSLLLKKQTGSLGLF